MSKTTWKVAAGRGGYYFDDFKEKGVVAIGWKNLGDFSGLHTRSDFAERVREHSPEASAHKVGSSAGQVFRFTRRMAVGDRVLTYDPSRRTYLLGTIRSEYRYDPEKFPEMPNMRAVDWHREIPRDALSGPTKNALGAISTLFQLSVEASDEIEGILEGRVSEEPKAPEPEASEEEEELLEDSEARALELIKDRVTALDWEEMQELVAGLLRGMGYKTRVSPRGADRGKDVVASPDGFGFESPRIIVEVKHRPNTAMGAKEIRGFLGGRHPDDKGLYVSTGGFSKDAYYEAERANIPLTLMDIDDLVEALLEHYDDMDIESQRLVPLKRIYWPI